MEVYGADAMMDAAIDMTARSRCPAARCSAGMEPTAGTQAYIAVGDLAVWRGMGGGPNGQGGVRA
ncbi:MAG: hypothetical protein ACLT4C_09205 [Butyricicoccus sp.]